MLLSELFKQLSHGELSRLSVGASGTGEIQEEHYEALLSHINLGLTELYKRFPLRMQEVVIQQYDHIQTYKLSTDYAQTNTASTQPIKYIEDSVYEPFTGNVLRIEKVIDEDGQTLFLNDDTQYWSVHTPSYDTVQVPLPEAENQMIVTYRADHDIISMGDNTPAEIDVPIPLSHLEALLHYVAYRAYTNVPSFEGGGSDSNNYLAKFEASCSRITNLNLINNDTPTNLKLHDRGWV